ncbi:hypothetical protein BC833DRAFT_268818 [Globomyces pollinis-pini]|nr:hypothetical protein BC833DRAFT_268818 [Globomyces pollinis-pini]
MSVHLKVWIRLVATLSDTALEQELKLKLINKNSINAFARAFVVRKVILIRSEVEVMKPTPTQIQSIYYFLLEKLHYLPSTQTHLAVLFHMQ